MIDNSNLLSTNSSNNQNLQNDIAIRKMQQNLIMMGFDIIMINKIISIYKIRTENEALDYLIKNDKGMWNHPFIPKEINPDEVNIGLLEQPKNMMNNVLTRINSLGISNNIPQIPQIPQIQRTSSILQTNEPDINEIKIDDDICEICGESKEFHNIKEYNNQNENDSLFNNENNNIIQSINSSNFNNSNDDEKNLLLNDANNSNIINNNNQTEDKKEENENPNECPICMGDLENPIEIEKCKHKFCQECFNSYLVNLINNNKIDQIPCPKNKCSNKELTEEFFSQYLSEQQYFKFRQFRAQNEIARDSKKIFCPLCDSYASIDGIPEEYDSNNPNYKKSTLKCQNGHEFCSCGRPLHENECYHDEKEFKEFLTQEKIKKCPKCGFLIKKNRGCNHMTCGNPICRYEFCWLCMKEAVPNHFDYGPCAGKQFFDPDSFSYRLMQSHPCIYCLYSIFHCLFVFIMLIVGFLAVPGFGLSFICYEIIFENDSTSQFFQKKYLRFFLFIICSCISFCIESIIYMIWALIISAFLLFISLVIFGLALSLLKNILKCLFFCCIPDIRQNNENPDINLEGNDLELANNNN